jgi:hypothetical protein
MGVGGGGGGGGRAGRNLLEHAVVEAVVTRIARLRRGRVSGRRSVGSAAGKSVGREGDDAGREIVEEALRVAHREPVTHRLLLRPGLELEGRQLATGPDARLTH